MRLIAIAILLLCSPILVLAETGKDQGIILENKIVDPRYFTLERQQEGTDILKEESALYNLAHLRLFEHILEALDIICEEHKKELVGMKFGSIIVAYEYPRNLEFNFLSEENRIIKKISYKEPQGELLIRSALVIFDFLEVNGKIDTNLVSFLQFSDEVHLEDEVILEYSIEKGSWIIKATGFVTRTKLFITTKTKVQLSTKVAKEHIAKKVAQEYKKELKKLGAEEITIEQKQVT